MNQVDETHRNLREAGAPLEIGGDGRADSPGHSAKYGSYTTMEINKDKIIDIQLVQVNLLYLCRQMHCKLANSYSNRIHKLEVKKKHLFFYVLFVFTYSCCLS